VAGLAERGQRLVEEPPFRLDQFWLEPYVDPELSGTYLSGFCECHRQTRFPVTRITKIDDQKTYICELRLLS
jgi:hypothetical protein